MSTPPGARQLTFGGCKLALLHADRVLVYRRDRKPGIPWPGMLDLPGGAREGGESPEQCVLRELHEEFGLRLPAERLEFRRSYPVPGGDLPAWFFAGLLHAREIDAIVFGSEGMYWQLMRTAEFAAHPEGIPHLRELVRDLLRAMADRAATAAPHGFPVQ